jgi:hypothetical protein
MEPCWLYTCARASKLHKQSRKERESARARAKGNERDFPCSLGEHYNDDSIFLTHRHTWYCFSPPLSVALRLNPFHRAIVGNRHRLSTPRTFPYRWWRTNKKTERNAHSICIDHKGNCTRMMLINGDNQQRVHHIGTRILLRQETIAEMRKVHSDVPIFPFTSLPIVYAEIMRVFIP